MRNFFVLTSICITIVLGGCKAERLAENPLTGILSSDHTPIKRVMDRLDAHELQIRYTQIDREGDSIRFTDYDFQVDTDTYFYPASTVKFPAAVAALEKLNEIDSLDRDTRFYVEGDSVETTVAKAISEIFAVSDNHANNRLIEFLGQDDLNDRMRKRGVKPMRIAHRLGYHSDDTATKPLIVYLNDSTTAHFEGTINNAPETLELDAIKKGVGFMADDSLVGEPFDFGLKNYYPIAAQHALLKRIVFPEKFPPAERFDLSDDQRTFLLSAMHALPEDVGYDPEKYYDGYCKFLMYGDTKSAIPDHIKIYNKVGWAYGTLTDCAYIKDERNKVEFMVTATLLVNNNGIFNDDTYEFEEIGIPFLAELGRQLYDYERERKN